RLSIVQTRQLRQAPEPNPVTSSLRAGAHRPCWRQRPTGRWRFVAIARVGGEILEAPLSFCRETLDHSTARPSPSLAAWLASRVARPVVRVVREQRTHQKTIDDYRPL